MVQQVDERRRGSMQARAGNNCISRHTTPDTGNNDDEKDDEEQLINNNMVDK